MRHFFEKNSLKIFTKDSLMSEEQVLDMEYVISELIIPEIKEGDEMSKMVKAVKKEFEENFGGSWTVFISKMAEAVGWAGLPPTGIFIEFEHEDCHFVVFRN